MWPFRLFLLLIALCHHLAVAQECGLLQACPPGNCCNILGSCGTGVGFCDVGSCLIQCPPLPECGVVVGGLQCPLGQCCNLQGLCGTDDLFCGVNTCQSQCSTSDVSPPPPDASVTTESPPPDATVTTEDPPPPPSKGSTAAGKRGKSSAPPPPPPPRSSGRKKKKNQAWVAGLVVPTFLLSSCAACVWKKKNKKKKKTSAAASTPANPSSSASSRGSWDTVLQSVGCIFSLFSSDGSKEEEDAIKADDGTKAGGQAHTTDSTSDDLRKVHDVDTATAHCDDEAAAEGCNV